MKSRLKKKCSDIVTEVGRPGSYSFPDFDQKIENDKINNIQYGPSMHTEWNFEKDLNYPEWNLQN